MENKKYDEIVTMNSFEVGLLNKNKPILNILKWRVVIIICRAFGDELVTE